jgi:peptidoglycan hydrolase-like protein with peptidoglycan-binding domain
LHLLGHGVGAIDGSATPEFEAALRSFQLKNGLAETGELDDATQAALSKFTGG